MKKYKKNIAVQYIADKDLRDYIKILNLKWTYPSGFTILVLFKKFYFKRF